jgi:hypothetical protein
MISSVSDWVSFSTFMNFSPALAFIGRTIVAALIPGRIRKNTPRDLLGPGIGGVDAIRSSPFGFMLCNA